MVNAEARAERLFAKQEPDCSLEQRRREWETTGRLHILSGEPCFSQTRADGVPETLAGRLGSDEIADYVWVHDAEPTLTIVPNSALTGTCKVVTWGG